MNYDEIIKHIKIYDTKELIVNGHKRFCYLIACDYCKELHYKPHCEIIRGLSRNGKFFCNMKCHGDYHSSKIEVSCLNCNKNFFKKPSQIVASGNNFCSKSCAATFNNKNKKFGTRRSKLEIILEEYIRNKLAIQINGILHFQPIYGQIKLDQILKLDNEKKK